MNNPERKLIPFTKQHPRIKYLGVKLTQGDKRLYTEKHKALMKELKDKINRKFMNLKI